MSEEVKNTFEKLFEIKEETTEERCPKCEEGFLTRKYQIGFGPLNGVLECECGYRDTLYGYIGKKCVSVKPLDDENNEQ